MYLFIPMYEAVSGWEYCVKIKLIALDWQWVTLISWCQMNCLGHCPPVMHKVEGKTHTILEKLKITSGKSTLFWHFFVKYFQITCVNIWIYLNKNNNTSIFTHVWLCVDLIFALLVAIRWFNSFWGGCESEKAKKNYGIKLVS